MRLPVSIVTLTLSSLLAACAPALKGTEMMPKSAVYDSLSSGVLNRNISLGTVTAKESAGGLTAPVTSQQYQEALILALRQAGWYNSSGNGRFLLDANISEIDQPLIGFNFTVKSQAEYTLTEQKSGKVRYHDKLTLPCTVLWSEAPVADVRLRQATACSVGENITHLLKTLSQRY